MEHESTPSDRQIPHPLRPPATPSDGLPIATGPIDGRGTSPIPAVDLFSGGGGASLGMEYTPDVDVTVAIDQSHSAIQTYGNNFDHPAIVHDLRDVSPTIIQDALPSQYTLSDILWVHGSPPCNGFSTAHGTRDILQDENTLLQTFIDWISELKPAVVTLENVTGMAQLLDGAVMDYLETAFWNNGYYLEWTVLDAADYGIPQHRKRVFGLAVPSGAEHIPDPWIPSPTHAAPGDLSQSRLSGETPDRFPYVTAKEALDDLPHPGTERTSTASTPSYQRTPLSNHVPANHSQRVREKLASLDHGINGTSVTDRRLYTDRPAPVMTVSQGTPPVHYADNGHGTRRLTVREVARLQGFPDTFTFAGTKLEQFQAAANAIPPRLQRMLGISVRHTLDTLDDRFVPNQLPPQDPPIPQRSVPSTQPEHASNQCQIEAY